MRTMTCLLVLLASAAGAGYAQDAADILKKTGETYRNAQTYYFAGQTTAETTLGGRPSSTELKFACALAQPGKVRVEYEYPNAGTWIRVSDGKTLTRYRSITKTFDQQPASEDDMRVLEGTPISNLERIDEDVVSAKVTGSEPVRIGGKDVDCYMVEVQYKPRTVLPNTEALPAKYWIDKERMIVLKRVTGTKSTSGNNPTVNTRTTTFTEAQVNSPVEDSFFAFQKPVK